ncbi:RHD3/Sey1 [Tuber borchii]|uniref:RHD3/Sey1 n=1 Tax=Tuber borchii TaxID=42251 RepID=A0A2T7A520_TUBBO|nr:RHD3/Sey1 [Tuber borchii]
MSFDGGGGHNRSGSIARNGTHTKDDSDTYSNGIQVIDENKEFTPYLPAYLTAQNLITAGFSYHVVAVFGSQSTGKSTLLNHLFGTHFSVMDEQARRQTTKGIWMSRAVEDTKKPDPRAMGNNILVMDVEGTDGRERGEDQDFERKSALFALATSEVLIVNIWEHQVGLYQGANMGLLKTVFEVNLGLFLKDRSTTHRSLLFFVIRDHIGHTPLQNLSNTLMQDLNRIWSSLSKPPGLEDSKINDFFDFEFVALPHKILQPEKFVEETQKLRKRFREGVSPEVEVMNGSNGVGQRGDGGIFLPAYHRRIPADGFPHYASGVWTQIITNKDLDLPSQQELLAQYRCDEIAATCTAGFNEIMSPFEEQAKKTGGESGGRYHKGVFERKREDLRENLEGRLRGLVVGQFSALSKRAVQEFTEEITGILKSANTSGQSASSNYDFAAVVNQTRSKVVDKFIAEASESYIPGAEWSNYENELTSLQAALDEIAARLRGEEMKRLVARLEKAIRSKLAEPVELEFRRMEDKEKGNLWDRVWKVWTETVGEGVEGFLTRAGSLNATEKERDIGAWKLRKKAWGVLKAKIEEEVMEGNILLKLRENFEDRFRYDEQGVPRVWKPADPIEQTYTAAREATLKLIPLISRIRLSTGAEPPLTEFLGDPPTDFEEDVDEMGIAKDEFEVLGEAKQVDLSTRFKRMADAVFVEAKRSTVSSVAEIPIYFWGLLLALGWNEIWAVLRSPVYFIFLLLCCAAAYVVHTLNLWGPILRVTNAMGQQAVDIGKERLRDFVADQNVAYPGRLNRTRGVDDDDDAVSLQTLDSEGRRRTRIKQEDDDE